MVKKIIPYLLIIFFSLISVLPLFQNGLHPTHDGEYHIIRFWQFYKNISQGNLFPRWAPDLNNGYGVPLFTYQYPLPNYVASITHLLGLSFINSFKYNLFFATLIGSIGMYIFSKQYFGEKGAVLSSIVYTFSPYKLLNIYVRGSVGELWALAVVPFLFWSIYKFINEEKTKYGALVSVFCALLVLSHNILGLLFFVLSIFFILLSIYSYRKIIIKYTIFLYVFIGLGLSSPFWLVALGEKSYVKGLEVFDYSRHFPEIYELLIPSWGTGFSGVSSNNSMSFQIGIINLMIVLTATILILKILMNARSINHSINRVDEFKKDNIILSAKMLSRKGEISLKIPLFFIISFFVSVFMMNRLSIFLWENIPLLAYLQFPWRFLSITIFSVSLLAGFIAFYIRNRAYSLVLIFFVALAVISSTIYYTWPAYYHQREDNYYLTKENFVRGTNSIGNIFNTTWLNEIPKERNIKRDYRVAKVYKSTATEKIVLINSNKEQIFYPEIAYFPGWKAKVNGSNREVMNVDGLIGIRLKNEVSLIKISLEPTHFQYFAYTLSFISIFTLLILLIRPVIIKKW